MGSYISGIENDGCHQLSPPKRTDSSEHLFTRGVTRSSSNSSTLGNSLNLTSKEQVDETKIFNPESSSYIASSAADVTSAETADDYWPVEGEPVQKPQLIHSWRCNESILSLAATNEWIIAGTGCGDIMIFSKETFAPEWVFKGHSGSVFSLSITPDEQFLFSGAADSLVKAWDLKARKELYTIYSICDIGDVFSVAWAPNHEYLFLGAQNASIQWIQLYDKESYNSTNDPSGLPSIRFDRFFDSKGPGGRLAPQQSANHKLVASNACAQNNTSLLEIPAKNIVQYAHFGYVYSLLVIKRTNPVQGTEEEYLVSGGGDGTVKIWNFNNGTIEQLYSLDTDSSVFSMCCQDSFLYCGLAAGQVCMFDLDTRQIIRVDQLGNDDVMTMSLYGECLFRSAKGIVRKWDSKRYHRGEWHAHDGIVLASILTDLNGRQLLVTGGNDSAVSMWDVSSVVNRNTAHKDPKLVFASFNSTQAISFLQNGFAKQDSTENQVYLCKPFEVATFTIDHMIQTLRDFVSYKTVSGHEGMYVNDCRRCATFLRNLFRHFGADSQLIPVDNGSNPVVYAKFSGNNNRPRSSKRSNTPLDSPTLAAVAAAEAEGPTKAASRILFYGHYDVISAGKTEEWSTDPFFLTNLDGYMYGRGVSDNKGPILAAIFAVAELVQLSELESDVVFLIEGEEESGSVGFQSAIERNKSLIGDIDWVLLSNSYWLDDTTPCLNYGLRGVIKATVEIKGEFPDLHSGVYGGVYREPTLDLVNLVSKLATDEGEIILPEFHNSVRPVSKEERKLYDAIESQEGCSTDDCTEELMGRWRYPSLTIHGITVSGPGNSTLIPQSATASLSLRIVPDQEMSVIKDSLTKYLHEQFASFKSDNHLKIGIFHEAEPWVGDPTNRAFKVLQSSLRDEWNLEPLFIREGGSIPTVRFLEKAFNAPAAQIPCGQASDGAHLDNERLRVLNFIKARNVLRRTFKEL